MTTSSPSQESESLDQQDRINPVVFYGSGLAILVFALWAMFFTEAAGTVIYAALAWISNSFGWFYFLACTGGCQAGAFIPWWACRWRFSAIATVCR